MLQSTSRHGGLHFTYGLVVRLRRSKGDQEGAGVEVSISLGLDEANCPLGAPSLREHTEIVEGRVFRRIDRHMSLGPALSASAIGETVKRRSEEATSVWHSLRLGLTHLGDSLVAKTLTARG